MTIRYLLAAALSLALVEGSAAAKPDCYTQDGSCGPTGTQEGTGGSGVSDQGLSGDDKSSDQSGISEDRDVTSDQGVGGTGTYDEGYGGTGEEHGTMQQPEQAQPTPPPSTTPETDVDRQTVIIQPTEDQAAMGEPKKERPENVGIGVAALGGVEGYTSSLAPLVQPGGAWGVLVTAQPTRVFGIELGYSGAVNNIEDPAATEGEIVRNGGNVNLKVGAPIGPVDTFVFGGVGISRANIQDASPLSGWRDDTFGQVPLGAGLNFHVGDFTAGARVSYGVLFDRDFAPPTPGNSLGFDEKEKGDIWNGLLQIGATF